ncbi:hypothetical protein C8R44DRAFT_803222 [Mycena epipterygia]|nr:hypothetical protein C8R44DRAFT_803222 [Mycena epipterygia]
MVAKRRRTYFIFSALIIMALVLGCSRRGVRFVHTGFCPEGRGLGKTDGEAVLGETWKLFSARRSWKSRPGAAECVYVTQNDGVLGETWKLFSARWSWKSRPGGAVYVTHRTTGSSRYYSR